MLKFSSVGVSSLISRVFPPIYLIVLVYDYVSHFMVVTSRAVTCFVFVIVHARCPCVLKTVWPFIADPNVSKVYDLRAESMVVFKLRLARVIDW